MDSQQTNDSRRKFLIKSGKAGAAGALFATFPNRSALAVTNKEWSPSAAASMAPSAAPLNEPQCAGVTPFEYQEYPSRWPNNVTPALVSGIDLDDNSLFRDSDPNRLTGEVTDALRDTNDWPTYLNLLTASVLGDLACQTDSELISPFANSSFVGDPILGVLWLPGLEANKIRIGVTTLFNALKHQDYPFDFEFACVLVRDMMNDDSPSGYRLPDGISNVSVFLENIYACASELA